MPLIVKQAFTVTLLSTIITPIIVAMVLGIGSVLFSKSEDVTRVTQAFTSMADDVKELKVVVQDISITTMENHLVVLKTVLDNEKRDEVFRAKTRARLGSLEERIKYERR